MCTDVPVCFSIKVLVFQKKTQNKKQEPKQNKEFLKVISLSTDVPVCFSIKVLVFQKKAQIGRNMGKHSVSRELLVCPP